MDFLKCQNYRNGTQPEMMALCMIFESSREDIQHFQSPSVILKNSTQRLSIDNHTELNTQHAQIIILNVVNISRKTENQ